MNREPVQTEDYKGYKIEIWQDEYPENPFEAWDGNPPLAVYSDGDITEYATKYGNANEVPTLTRDQIKANLKEIMELCEVKSVFEFRDRREYDASIYDTINEAISIYIDDQYKSDRLELLATVYGFAGIPALCKSIHGYSQGDYCEVLAVATKEFQDACGNDPGFWDDPDGLKVKSEPFCDQCQSDMCQPDQHTDTVIFWDKGGNAILTIQSDSVSTENLLALFDSTEARAKLKLLGFEVDNTSEENSEELA